jgi:transcriptional regulator with XRE-family HTH domain
MTFGEKLKIARKMAGLTQSQLASFLDGSTQTVKDWEAGRRTPPLDRVVEVAQILEKPVSWFVDDNVVAERLATVRKQSRVSTQDMADYCGVDLGTIEGWETGKLTPSADEIHAWEAATGASIGEPGETNLEVPPEKDSLEHVTSPEVSPTLAFLQAAEARAEERHRELLAAIARLVEQNKVVEFPAQALEQVQAGPGPLAARSAKPLRKRGQKQ